MVSEWNIIGAPYKYGSDIEKWKKNVLKVNESQI